MKNHEKARELYKEADPEKDFLDMVIDKMNNVPAKYTLKELIEDLTKSFAHNEFNEAVCVLEAIYEALSQKEELSSIKDDLFDQAFHDMCETAKSYNRDDFVKNLEEYYPDQPEQEVDISGNILAS